MRKILHVRKILRMKRILVLVVFSAATLAAADAPAPAELSPIWRWANFLILAGVLGYVMAKFLPPLFASRSTEIRQGISEAQQMKQDAERRSAEMDARLNALGADIEKFRTQSTAEMQQEGERISRETAVQIKKIEQQAAVELESVGKTARRQLKEYAAELALGLAEERLRGRMDNATESALVDGFVRDLEHQTSQITSQKTGSKN
jgi:F-type H+-transporting ATPase subunit b